MTLGPGSTFATASCVRCNRNTSPAGPPNTSRGRHPPTPDFSRVRQLVSSYRADSLSGLPLSWHCTLSSIPPSRPDNSELLARAPSSATSRVRPLPRTWMLTQDLVRRFRESEFSSIKAMMEGKDCTIPKHAGSDACLAWAFKGQCNTQCSRKHQHRALLSRHHSCPPLALGWMPHRRERSSVMVPIGTRDGWCTDGHQHPLATYPILWTETLLATVPARPSGLSASKPGSSDLKLVSSHLTLASGDPSPSTPPQRNLLPRPALTTSPTKRKAVSKPSRKPRPTVRQVALSYLHQTTTAQRQTRCVSSWLVHCLR